MQLSELIGMGRKVANLMPTEEPGTISCFARIEATWPHEGFQYDQADLILIAETVCERIAMTGAFYMIVGQSQTPFFWPILERVAATYGMYLLVRTSMGRHPDFYTLEGSVKLHREFSTGRLHLDQEAA